LPRSARRRNQGDGPLTPTHTTEFWRLAGSGGILIFASSGAIAMPPTSNRFLDRLAAGIVLCGEGYVFELERRGYVKAGPYVPEVVLDHPSAVEELHRELALCGSDVVLALTYYAHRDKMRVVGRERDVEELNRQAVRLARKVAAEENAVVAGNISNTWVYDAANAEATGKVVRQMYDEQIRWAKEEGVDFILAETIDHLGEAMIAVDAIKSAGLPAVVNLAVLETKTKDGVAVDEACQMLHDRGADVVGLNCSRGPATMLPMLERVVARVKGPVAALPVAYRTTPEQPTFHTLRLPGQARAFPIDLEPFLLTRAEMA